jgi:hypothetical protein
MLLLLLGLDKGEAEDWSGAYFWNKSEKQIGERAAQITNLKLCGVFYCTRQASDVLRQRVSCLIEPIFLEDVAKRIDPLKLCNLSAKRSAVSLIVLSNPL